jgi:hypothetical protein
LAILPNLFDLEYAATGGGRRLVEITRYLWTTPVLHAFPGKRSA